MTSSTTSATALTGISEAARGALTSLAISRLYEDDEVEYLYAAAYKLAQAGQYRSALDYARLAAVFRPAEPRYVRGYAFVMRKLGQLEDAMAQYRLADLIEPCNPRNVLPMAETALEMNQPELGRELLQVLIRWGQRTGSSAPELERAQALLDLMPAGSGHAA